MVVGSQKKAGSCGGGQRMPAVAWRHSPRDMLVGCLVVGGLGSWCYMRRLSHLTDTGGQLQGCSYRWLADGSRARVRFRFRFRYPVPVGSGVPVATRPGARPDAGPRKPAM